MSKTFTQDFKRNFFRGLAAMLPTILTLMIIIFAFQFIQKYVGRHLNVTAQWVVVQFRTLSGGGGISWRGDEAEWINVENFWSAHHLDLLGIVLAFVAVYIFGRFLASLVGRSIWRLVDTTLSRLPFIRQIYPQVKQVTDYLFAGRAVHFSRVVAVEYPRRGMWSLGLVTAPGMRSLQDVVKQDLLTIFIPSSPTPMTGYTVTVPRQDVIEVPLTIDEAFRFTISGGVILPPAQQTGEMDAEEARKSRLLPPGSEEQEQSEDCS